MSRMILLLLGCLLSPLLRDAAADESSAPSSLREFEDKLLKLTEIDTRHIVILLQDLKTFQWKVRSALEDIETSHQEVKTSLAEMKTSQETLQHNTNSIQQDIEILTAPSSCQDVSVEGIHKIVPLGSHQPRPMYCEVDATGAWTVILRRVDGEYNFPEQPWTVYREGFGDIEGSYWAGLQTIHELTRRTPTLLKIELEDWEGEVRYAQYSSFNLSSELDGYRLSVAGYSGDAGDSLAYHNGVMFSTQDRDNDSSSRHCAQVFNGAWWYKSCSHSCLTGEYLRGQHSKGSEGLWWRHWRGVNYSYKRAIMKIRHL